MYGMLLVFNNFRSGTYTSRTLILQFGTRSNDINNAWVSFIFPISFSSTNYHITALGISDSTTKNGTALMTRNKYTGSGEIGTGGHYAGGFDCFCIGY